MNKDKDGKLVIDSINTDKEEKSEKNVKDHDDLIFANRNIKSIFIRSCIQQIKPNAFYMCKKMQEVEFSSDSKLNSIGKKIFCILINQ